MEELIQHCLSEIAFEGELGLGFEQLKQTIQGFYESHSSVQQKLDDPYCSFILSLIQHQPSVKICKLPDGPLVHVSVPPLPRAGKKDKDANDAQANNTIVVSKMDEVPEAKTSPMNKLLEKYGEKLRVALDAEAIFVGVTGSHAKPAKLTPTVYAALQIIGRARESGISAVDLGKATGFDQKTIFYIIKQLIDLNLAVKLRRGGNSQNFVVHKYYYDRSATWREVHVEESRGHTDYGPDEKPVEDDDTLQFGRIDQRHLTNLNIVRQRIVKLLQSSENEMVPYTNIALRIGFYPTDRTDRRFFLTRLNELVKEGTIEKVFAPNKNPEATARSIYVRLVRQRSVTDDEDIDVVRLQGMDEQEEDLVATDEQMDRSRRLKSNVTFHKQTVDLIENSGAKGITLNELVEDLQQFDRRTIELFLSRMIDQQPPPHLADLSIFKIQEIFGREKRFRYYTLKGYTQLMASENPDYSTDNDDLQRLTASGGYSMHTLDEFYARDIDLTAHLSKYKPEGGQKGRPRKTAWPKTRKETVPTAEGSSALKEPEAAGKQAVDNSEESNANGRANPKKEEKKKKKKEYKNPILPDGSRKRGRPVKDPDIAEQRRQKRLKREGKKKAVDESGIGEKVLEIGEKRKIICHELGEPEIGSVVEVSHNTSSNINGSSLELQAGIDSLQITNEPSPVRSKRGRPPKKRKLDNQLETQTHTASPSHVPSQLPDSAEHEKGSLGAPSSSNRDVGLPQSKSKELPSNTPSIKGCSKVNDAATRVPTTDAMSIDEGNDGQLGYVGKLVPASFTQVSERITLPTNVQVEAHDILLSPLSELTDLPSRAESVGPIHVDNQVEDLDALQPTDESGDTHLTELATEPTSAPAQEFAPLLVKKGKSALREAKNISQMRRENELVRLVAESGGILNTSPVTFALAYKDLVSTLAKAGEPTSIPVGSQIDRRTLRIALDNLQSAGRLKILETNIWTATGGSRQAKIVYLPHLSNDDVRKFQLSLGSPIEARAEGDELMRKKADVDPNGPRAVAEKWIKENSRLMPQDRWGKDEARAESLLRLDDEVMREVFLMEKQTLSQLYGFICGKFMRARILHLQIIQELERNTENKYIVSSDNRVVDWAYFDSEVPLSTYCSYMSSISYMEEIEAALATPEGQQTRVKDVPGEWRAALRAGRTSSRERIFELLDILKSLKIATPVRVSIPADRERTGCMPEFEPMPLSWESEVPVVGPQYWMFNKTAPVFLLAQRDSPPTFYGYMPITRSDEASKFWDTLRSTSLDKTYCAILLSTSRDSCYESETYGDRTSAALCRSRSWKDNYAFTWHQRYLLDKYIEPPESPEDKAEQVTKIAHILCAPLKAVQSYLEGARERRNEERLRIQRREGQRELKKQKALSAKILLAQKATEAAKQREKAWDALLLKVCGNVEQAPLSSRLKRLRRLFIQGNVVQDSSAWEKQLSEAIKASEKTKNIRGILRPTMVPARGQPANVQEGGNSTQMAIDLEANQHEAIDSLKSSTSLKKPRKKATKRDEDSGEKAPQRRRRFHWHEVDDELVRDAYVVIQARCRSSRLDYGALDQLFPSEHRDRARIRIKHLKERPGAEGYLRRLEVAWTDIWKKFRGTEALPDDNPTSSTNFDLKAHIEFLRKHIDKNALRSGLRPVKEDFQFALPLDISKLHSSYIVSEKAAQQGFEFLHNPAIGEESREKMFQQNMLVLDNDEFRIDEPIDDRIAFAESALKVVIGTPNENYDAHHASTLLNAVGNGEVQRASANLLSQNVCAKLVRDPSRLAPGRTLKISEANQNALIGPVSRELFADAMQSERIFASEQEEWREWPLTSTDGDTAAILQLLSDHKLFIKFDMSQAKRRIAALDGNSKKAYDDDFEIQLEFRVQDNSIVDEVGLSPGPIGQPEQGTSGSIPGHGKTANDVLACCALLSEGVVDCTGCIADSSTKIYEWTKEDQEIADKVIRIVEASGTKGLGIVELQTKPESDYKRIVKQLHSLPVPVLHMVGYQTSLIVSARHVSPWAIILPRTKKDEVQSISKVFPRRWIDINGNRIPEVWDAALRAVAGYVHLRPGISHVDLRHRLKVVYDRQEVMDLILYLHSERYLIVRTSGEELVSMPKATTDEEERAMHWFVNDLKHWYMAC